MRPRIADFDQDPSAQIDGLTEAATKVAVIPQSISVPNRKGVLGNSAMYGMFFTRFDVIMIYGVDRSDSQDRILQEFVSYRRTYHTRPLRVKFYERENWAIWKRPGGASGGSRGPEIIIRREVIR